MHPTQLLPPDVMSAVMNSRDRKGPGLPPNVHPRKGYTIRSYFQVTRLWRPSSVAGQKPKLSDWLAAEPSPLDMTVRQQRRQVEREVAKGELKRSKAGTFQFFAPADLTVEKVTRRVARL